MTLGILIGFLTGLLGWQINLVSLHRGIDRGRWALLLVGCGAILGDLIWIALAFAGAKSILASHREYLKILKWLGIVTITFAGLKILFHNSKTQAEPKNNHWGHHTRNFFIGLLLVVGNPALLLLWVGTISFLLTHVVEKEGAEYYFHFLFLSGFALGGIGWFLILSFLILPRIRKWKDERFHAISKFFAAALLVGAGVLVFKKF